MLDISLALFDTLDLVKSSVDSEVVFQATLQVRGAGNIVMSNILHLVLLATTAAEAAIVQGIQRRC
jgi:hypothetical protein